MKVRRAHSSMQQNQTAPVSVQEHNPENPEEAGEEGEGTSQGDNLMMRKMRMVRECAVPGAVRAKLPRGASTWCAVSFCSGGRRAAAVPDSLRRGACLPVARCLTPC